MGAEEPLLEETKETLDELEETLSLCDLPLYSDQSADFDQEFSLASNSTSSSSNEDYFEFFSQELHPSALPPENIVFCGKLIPYQKLPTCKHDSSNQAEIKIQTRHTKKKSWRLKFISTKHSRRQSSQPKNGSKSTTTLMHHKRMYNTGKLGKGHGFNTHRKAKWHFLLFGISRFSPVVELTDIRRRQRNHRRSQSTPSSPPPTPSLFGFRNGYEKGGERRWGLWGLIRALSCGGNRLPTAVAAAAEGGGVLPE